MQMIVKQRGRIFYNPDAYEGHVSMVQAISQKAYS